MTRPMHRRGMPIVPAIVGMLIAAFGCLASTAVAADLSGTYSNDTLTVVLSQSSGKYTGTITKGNSQFPVKADATDAGISGTFNANGADFAFTASIDHDTLTLVCTGKTYTLHRAAAANPLDGPASPANPLDSNAPAQRPPANAGSGNFDVLGQTDKGQALYIKLPAGSDLNKAIGQTLFKLATVLDGQPTVTGGFTGANHKDKGGATFTGSLKGKKVNGVILCSLGGDGNSANVVIAAEGASKAEVQSLLGVIPRPMNLSTHNFPDNSGSVDLPAGWTTQTQSASTPIVVKGPAGQMVVFNLEAQYNDPNCTIVRQWQQNYQQAKASWDRREAKYQSDLAYHNQHPQFLAPISPGPAPTPPDADPNDTMMKQSNPMRFVPYCDGVGDYLKVWFPITQNLQKKYGQPYSSLDKTILVTDAPVDPRLGQAKAGVAYYAVTDHVGNTATPMRVVADVTTVNSTPGENWLLTVCSMRGPDATFDKDLPTMYAILSSVKLNNDVVNRETAARGQSVIDASKAAFDRMEATHQKWEDQQAAQFADFQRQMEAQHQNRRIMTSNMIEYASDVQNVLDTETGEYFPVSWANSKSIISGLNAGADVDNRYVPIELWQLRPNDW